MPVSRAPGSRVVDELLKANRIHALDHRPLGPAEPSRGLAVVSCMDARMDVWGILGLANGDAHVIRNAGGRMTADVARSLSVSSHALGVREVVFIQHTQCGMAKASNEEFRHLTGAEIDFRPILDHRSDLAADLEELKNISWLEKIGVASGLLYDLETGLVDELAGWSR